jgi:phage regulator Rha-like protein
MSLLHNYIVSEYLCDQTNEDKMGKEKRNTFTILVAKPEEKDHLEDLDVNRRMI